jgi:hypothetical protein
MDLSLLLIILSRSRTLIETIQSYTGAISAFGHQGNYCMDRDTPR